MIGWLKTRRRLLRDLWEATKAADLFRHRVVELERELAAAREQVGIWHLWVDLYSVGDVNAIRAEHWENAARQYRHMWLAASGREG